jgi:hypothetical protein
MHAITKKREYPERYGWWLNELSSLGVLPKKRNDLNDLKELSDLTENIKQTLLYDYKKSSSNNNNPSIILY